MLFQTLEALLEAILLQAVQSGRRNLRVIPWGGFSSHGRGRAHMGRAGDVPGLGSSFSMTESTYCVQARADTMLDPFVEAHFWPHEAKPRT
jgi:hypothetical protein